MSRNGWLMLIAVFVHLSDITATWVGLQLGVGQEGNPLYNWLISFWGFWPTALFLKSVAVGLTYAVLRYSSHPMVYYSISIWLTLALGTMPWSIATLFYIFG
jgi:hypothetical protein